MMSDASTIDQVSDLNHQSDQSNPLSMNNADKLSMSQLQKNFDSSPDSTDWIYAFVKFQSTSEANALVFPENYIQQVSKKSF